MNGGCRDSLRRLAPGWGPATVAPPDPGRNKESEMEDRDDKPEEQGTFDVVSVLYVVGGIPLMILFFVAVFLLVGSCDSASTYIHA